ncbi:hypothetical protein HanIR_Chr13g0630381 [Helianthus annuus]|nr:hypothetical protein HanIR_Chr13g0630381 [Helianthus annuus]
MRLRGLNPHRSGACNVSNPKNELVENELLKHHFDRDFTHVAAWHILAFL